jgi:hypothetical protein
LYLAPLVLKHNITMAKQVISNNLGFCVINFTSAIFKYSIGKSSAYWMYTPKKKRVLSKNGGLEQKYKEYLSIFIAKCIKFSLIIYNQRRFAN